MRFITALKSRAGSAAAAAAGFGSADCCADTVERMRSIAMPGSSVARGAA
jgi:hypothetical protein